MGTSKEALDVARWFLDIGTKEVPDGSNKVAGITDQGGFYPAAWCDAFVITCLRAVNVDPGPHTMWVSTTMDYFRGRGRTFKDARAAQPGDLVAFEWGTTSGGYDHIAFVEYQRSDGLVTIEGNVGNRVQRLFRSWSSGMAEFARPDYQPLTDQEIDVPLTVDEINAIAEKAAQRTRDYLVNPETALTGVVIDAGARGALAEIHTGVSDPVHGIRAMVARLSPSDFVAALPDDYAKEVVDLLVERLKD